MKRAGIVPGSVCVMTKKPSTPSMVPRLSLMDASCIMVGIVVGSSIFRNPPFIGRNAIGACLGWAHPGSTEITLAGNDWLIAYAALWGVWVFGGLLAFCGALCYAELVTSRPTSGGTFSFLQQAFGSPLAVLFAWCEFWIIRPGNIGGIALVFAEFAEATFRGANTNGPPLLPKVAWGAIAITVLTLVHLAGLRPGTKTQNTLAVLKVVGLSLVIVLALLPMGLSEPSSEVSTEVAPKLPIEGCSLATAIVIVMFTYGGWSDLSYVASEVQEPRKNLLRSLILGMLVVMALYLGANGAMIYRRGLLPFLESSSLASQMAELPLGAFGERIISLLVCISCLGAIAGMIFTGARVPSAVGEQVSWLKWLAKWNEAQGTPWVALVLQGALSVGLMLLFGANPQGFENLVLFTAPFYWTFLGLVAVALMILRSKPTRAESPYRVPLYPVVPLLFAVSSFLMVYSTVDYSIKNFKWESTWGILVLVSGGAVALLVGLTNSKGVTKK